MEPITWNWIMTRAVWFVAGVVALRLWQEWRRERGELTVTVYSLGDVGDLTRASERVYRMRDGGSSPVNRLRERGLL